MFSGTALPSDVPSARKHLQECHQVLKAAQENLEDYRERQAPQQDIAIAHQEVQKAVKASKIAREHLEMLEEQQRKAKRKSA